MGFTPQSDVSSEAFEEEVEVPEKLEEVPKMSRPTDTAAAAETDNLDDLKDRIEFKMDRMKASRVNVDRVKMMEEQMKEVQVLTEQYGVGVRSFARKFLGTNEDFCKQL